MSLLDEHLESLPVDLPDRDGYDDDEDYREGCDTALTEAVDGYVESMTLDDMVALLVENHHLKFMYDEPMIDLTSFDTIAKSCAYNLIEKSWRARNS